MKSSVILTKILQEELKPVINSASTKRLTFEDKLAAAQKNLNEARTELLLRKSRLSEYKIASQVEPGFKITKPKLVLCVIFLYSLFSVFATKDYFNYNRIKENIIVDLMHNKKVKAEDIHGGFEFMMWHFYDTGGWNRYWDHRGYEYQITFGGDLQPYHIIEKHPYKRYFPFKVDTLYLIQKNAE
jgi:hypothetical protein